MVLLKTHISLLISIKNFIAYHAVSRNHIKKGSGIFTRLKNKSIYKYVLQLSKYSDFIIIRVICSSTHLLLVFLFFISPSYSAIISLNPTKQLFTKE